MTTVSIPLHNLSSSQLAHSYLKVTIKPKPPPQFGLPMRKAYFAFSHPYTPLNHGSFGAYPSPVQETQNQYQRLAHERPDTFIVYDLPGLIDGARKRVVEDLLGGTEKGGIDVDEVVLVNNATTGINVVLRNLKFEEGDVIVYFSTIYSACEKSIASVAEMSPVGGERIELNHLVEDDDLVELLRRKVVELRTEGKRVRLAMFDTVLTFPGVRMPWERLVEVCREMGVLSLIDGAHGIGKSLGEEVRMKGEKSLTGRNRSY
jgi:selenocysteine lyase/cysteine desulfurase